MNYIFCFFACLVIFDWVLNIVIFTLLNAVLCCISLKYWTLFWHIGSYNMNILRLIFKDLLGWIHSNFYSSANLVPLLKHSSTLLKMLPNASGVRSSLNSGWWKQELLPALWGPAIVFLFSPIILTLALLISTSSPCPMPISTQQNIPAYLADLWSFFVVLQLPEWFWTLIFI